MAESGYPAIVMKVVKESLTDHFFDKALALTKRCRIAKALHGFFEIRRRYECC